MDGLLSPLKSVVKKILPRETYFAIVRFLRSSGLEDKLIKPHIYPIDLNIFAHHKYHSARLHDEPGKKRYAGDFCLAEDPWSVNDVQCFLMPGVVDYFLSFFDGIISAIVAANPKIIGVSLTGSSINISRARVATVLEALAEMNLGISIFSDSDIKRKTKSQTGVKR